MIKMLIFHSGNPLCITSRQATSVANKMQEIFKDKLELHIHKTDSTEAIPYNLKRSFNVFIDDKPLPLDVAISETNTEQYITSIIRQMC